jgi:hypothetical protein
MLCRYGDRYEQKYKTLSYIYLMTLKSWPLYNLEVFKKNKIVNRSQDLPVDKRESSI